MRALVYAACAAFVLSLAALFLPRAKKPLPGEKTPAPAWLASLTGVFMAAGVPLFALERLASGLSADPAFLPGVSFGPLPWAFAALAAAAFCLMGAKRPVWLGACAWLSLVGAGAATTTVRGGYAAEGAGALVRCVVLGAGAQLRGVTVSGGLCQTAGDETDDGSAAGVLADATAVVEDCVVENCRSRQYGAAVGGTFRRCVFRGNWAMGEACSVGSLREAENCLFAGNRGDSLLWGYERIDNCTFLYDNVKVNGRRISTFGAAAPGAVVRNSALILSPTSPTPMPALVNCLLPKIGATTWRWAATNGVNATDCLLEKDVEVPEAWAAGWDGRPGATFAGIDGGANAAAPPGTDLAGAQRIQNGTVDVGCYERDWLAAYTAAFARRGVATVTATEGAVYARADGTLVLAPGGRLTAVVDVTADAACAVSAVVTGGALSVSVNGVLKGTLTAAEARLLVGRLVAGDVLTLALDGGAAEAPFLWLVRGGCLIIR